MNKKNLLILTFNYPNHDNSYTSGIFVKEQVAALKSQFNAIYVISPLPLGAGWIRDTRQTDYQYDNVKVFFPRFLTPPKLNYHGAFARKALEKLVVVSLIKRERLKFDLIHAHMTWPSGAVAVELKRSFNVPVVITEHSSKTLQREIARKNPQFIDTWKGCDTIIRVNTLDKPIFTKVGVPPEKVIHVPYGFDGRKFSVKPPSICRRTLDIPEDRKVILNVGNFYDPEKGHSVFVNAIRHIIDIRQDILVYIIGSGRLKEKISSQVSKLEMQNFVRIVGSKPHHEIPLWMNACDLFVMPSLMESFGIVQIEAMACGKPVVATRNGGSEEIIISPEYGLLVDPGNPEQLAEGILVALDRDWDRKAIRQYAERFMWDKLSKRLLEVYSDLLVVKK